MCYTLPSCMPCIISWHVHSKLRLGEKVQRSSSLNANLNASRILEQNTGAEYWSRTEQNGGGAERNRTKQNKAELQWVECARRIHRT